ncbi:MAG: helix-turn-helix transcriptional regulator [bacterium]|nr:helix-turn-helix transcriptional regulator [bacterium]
MSDNKLGDFIKDLRSKRSLGLRETAARIGKSATYLSKIESGIELSPTEEVIRQLATVLDGNFDEMMRLAGRLPADITEAIRSDPGMPAFLRRARNESFTSEELMKVLDEKKKK